MRTILYLAGLLLLAGSLSAETVTLTVTNPGGQAVAGWPLTTGMPFPAGVLTSPEEVRLLDEQGRELPLQALVTSQHRDGSIRWLLLDFICDVPAGGRQLQLEFGPGIKRAAIPVALQVTTRPETLEVNTGPLQVTFNRRRGDGLSAVTVEGKPAWLPGHQGGAYFVTDRGEVFRACQDEQTSVEIEAQGPLRTVITTRGWYVKAGGERQCQFIIRYHFTAGQPVVRIMYTWLMTEDSRKLRFRDIGFTVPIASTQAAFMLEDGQSLTSAVTAGQPAGLVQYDYDRFKLLSGAAGTTAQPLGLVTTTGPQVTCSLQVRDFRQLFPKEFSITPTGLNFHVWPAHGVINPNRQIEDANLQYLWYAHEGEVLDFQAPEAFYNHRGGHSEYEYRYLRSARHANALGLAKTHELWLTFRPAGSAVDLQAAHARQQPPLALPDTRWMCDSGVFGAMQPYSPELFPRYEKLISDNFDAEQRMQAHTRDYGMWNYGDSHTSWDMSKRRWNDVYRCWRNTHHGAPRVPWLLYVRSGDPKYLAYAVRNTRHVLDIDFCHYSTPEFEALDYPQGKLKGALNDYKGIVHWHSGNRLTDYNSMTDFALWYWHLTGDRWGLEVAQQWGEAVKAKFTAPFGSRSGTGTLSALIDLYTDTGEESYRPLIEAFFTHLTTKVQNWEGDKKFSDHVLAYWPQYKNRNIPLGAFPEWENYAPWIERYWDMNPSEAARKSLVAWADSYLEGYGDMSSLWGTREYMNILAYAYLATRDPKYLGRGVWEVDKAVASVYAGDDPLLAGFMQLGQVSLGGYIIQRLPAFMKALAVHGQPVAPDPLIAAVPGFQLLFTRTRPVVDGKPRKIETVELWVLEDKDQEFALSIPTQHTYETRTYTLTVTDPDGQVAVQTEETYPKGNKVLEVRVPADGRTGVYRCTIAAEGSYGRVTEPVTVTPKLPVALPVEGRLVPAASARYYLFVPADQPLTLELGGLEGSAASAMVVTPNQQRLISAAVPGKPQQVLTLVPEGRGGQCWEMILSGGVGTLRLLVEGKPTAQLLFPEPYPAAVCEAFAQATR